MGWLETQITNLLSWKARFGKWVHDWHTYLNRRVDNVDDNIGEIVKTVNGIPKKVNKAIDDAKKAILSAVYKDYVKPLSYYLDASLMDVKAWIKGVYEDLLEVHNDLKTVFDFIEDIDTVIDARIEGLKDKIIAWIEDKFITIVEHVLEQEVKE